jgi:hypothetical protein
LFQNLGIDETGLLEEASSLRIYSSGVLTTIQLDDQASLEAHKVRM